MWSEGVIGVPQADGSTVKCHYWVKHYEEPSEIWGIDGGRISKMTIKVEGQITLNYDRGWDVEPEDEASQLAYLILMQNYN